MTQVRINQVNTDVRVTDIEALMSPEIMEKLVRAVQQRLQQEQHLQQISDDDRRLTEGAMR